MKKYAYSVLALLLIMGMILTNPKEQDHKDKLKEVLSETTDQLTSESAHPVGALLGNIIKSTVIDIAVDELTIYHNYILFSTTMINGQKVTIGAFGYVYSKNAKEIANSVKKQFSL